MGYTWAGSRKRQGLAHTNPPPAHAKWGNPIDSDGPPYGRYAASEDKELTMKEGDIIHVIREDDSGWWQVASPERERAREGERESEREGHRDGGRQRERKPEKKTERATSSTSSARMTPAGGRSGIRL